MFPFHYTSAIVSRIPNELFNPNSIVDDKDKGKKSKKKKKKSKNAADEDEALQNVDINKCKKEFQDLTTVLRDIGIDVLELQADRSPFIGDLAFVLNGMGLIMRPKSLWRTPEVETISMILKKELDIPVIEIDDKEAYIEKPDILFTGKEFFVGLSNFTNLSGALFLAKVFPEFPCTPIKVPGSFHLTHYVNVAAPDILCVSDEQTAQDILKRMERESTIQYQTITVPEFKAAQVLYLNGTLLHLSYGEIPQSYQILSERLSYLRKRTVDLTELSKLNGSFSRLVVLLKKPRKKKPVIPV